MIEGYLLLAVSIAAGTVKGYLGKKTSVYAENETDAVFLNSVRILICALISGVLACVGGNIANIASVEPGTIAVSAMNGASTAVFIVSWLLAVKTGAFILEAGYRKIRLDPSLLGLEEASVEIPTPFGKISCIMKKGEKIKLNVPKEITVEYKKIQINKKFGASLK